MGLYVYVPEPLVQMAGSKRVPQLILEAACLLYENHSAPNLQRTREFLALVELFTAITTQKDIARVHQLKHSPLSNKQSIINALLILSGDDTQPAIKAVVLRQLNELLNTLLPNE